MLCIAFLVNSNYTSAIQWQWQVALKRRVSPGHAQSGQAPEFGYRPLNLSAL